MSSWKPSNQVDGRSASFNKEQTKHLNTLQSVKPTLDNKSPYKPYFLAQKRKNRYVLMKDQEVNIANTVLLSKMMKIEKGSGSLMRIINTYRPSTPQFNSYKNTQRRRSIETQNQQMARKLLNATTHYELEKIKQDSEAQMVISKNICQNSRRSRYLDMSRVSIQLTSRMTCADENIRPPRSLESRRQQRRDDPLINPI